MGDLGRTQWWKHNKTFTYKKPHSDSDSSDSSDSDSHSSNSDSSSDSSSDSEDNDEAYFSCDETDEEEGYSPTTSEYDSDSNSDREDERIKAATEGCKSYAGHVAHLVACGRVMQQGAAEMGKVFRDVLLPKLVDDLKIQKLFPATWYMVKKLSGNLDKELSKGTWLDMCPKLHHHVFPPDSKADTCPECGEGRYKSNLTPRCRMWLPDLGVRIQDLYNVPELAELFEYPLHRETGDGDAWDAQLLGSVDLATVACIVFVALCSDGTVLETWRKVDL